MEPNRWQNNVGQTALSSERPAALSKYWALGGGAVTGLRPGGRELGYNVLWCRVFATFSNLSGVIQNHGSQTAL